MTHCFGAVNALLNTLTHGCRLDIENAFDPEQVLSWVQERAITSVYGVPTHFTMLAEAQAASGDRYDLSSLVKGCCGGGEISVDLQNMIERHLGLSGLTHAYGMTESSAIISQSEHSMPRDLRLGTAGRPLPDVEVLLVDEAGTPVPAGEPGDVLIRGFNVHAGYFMLDPDPSLRPDGTWVTGDIASSDSHGCLTLRGRSKDMYKTSGFNVYPIEVESYLARHPSVGEVAVVGVPHARKQEVGAAFVIPAPGQTVDVEALKAFAREGLVGYKTPEHVFVVADLPRSNATLKIQKHELRAQATELLAASQEK
jgi:acyl-CoA synthetase (AMP-forming)/AMP-acid ligase II